MNDLGNYITTFTGFPALILPLTKDEMKGLAIYVREAYTLSRLQLNNVDFLLVEPNQATELRILQTQKHIATLTKMTGLACVLLLHDVPAYVRGRLIEKRINFIIPGKQIYMPDMLIHLKVDRVKEKKKGHGTALTPTAQFLVLYQLLHEREPRQLENLPLKDIARQTGYAANTITTAVKELEEHQLITIKGTKEKYIQFNRQGKELWADALKKGSLTTPVLKRIYVDAKPDHAPMLRANASALSAYTAMNPDAQEYFAIDKSDYYTLNKANKLIHPNPTEGQYCLEVWKYDPARLAARVQPNNKVVDPLSLYLSMLDMQDERIEMALDQIINQFPW